MDIFGEANIIIDGPLCDIDFLHFEIPIWEPPKCEIGEITKTSTDGNDFEKNKIFEISKEEKKEKQQKQQKHTGRKRIREHKSNEKIHTKYDPDNLVRKIQVDFYKFLVSFINDILMNLGIKKKFLKITYKYIKNVKKENIEKFKLTEIGHILSQSISTKYRKQYLRDKDKNYKLYLEVTTKYDNIKKLLNETSINIFRNYYYKKNRDLNEYNLNFKLSNNIQTYENLLEKNRKDKLYIKKLEEIVDKFYLPHSIFILDKSE